MHLNVNIQNALTSNLNAALQFLTQKLMSKVGSCGQINGFIRQVQGDARVNKITPQQALQLINAAQSIQRAFGEVARSQGLISVRYMDDK
jgi:hypothetical protein